MSLKSCLLVSCVALAFGTTSASAGLVPVTSYDMNNGNGATQFTGGNNYFDFSYTNSTTHTVDPNASKNGSNQAVPNNAAPKDAPLSGGTGILTDGTIATQVYSLVTSSTGTIASGPFAGQPTQYVGWKYQDPTIIFHLTPGQSVSSINIFAAANNPAIGDLNGLVAAPTAVKMLVNGVLVSTTFSMTSVNANTAEITLTGFGSISSDSIFSLQFFRGPLQQDGIDYYNNHVKGYNPANPYDSSNCVGFCDPDSGPYSSGFRTEAALGQTGNLLPGSGLEPWILLSEVQFFSTAVPEPSTWIMMIAGFAALGFVSWKRKARPALAAA
ncbi:MULTISPECIES: PEP-CTERM sorting domain-containing protein [Bradyrhizobium]|jgi:hypothetical protein|uniref:PEP-CTERM sorting domain-containing protein n=1 Tax=Bradyrhizobium TaxID=374 RepID=UPI0003FCA90F|nr:MULTISPECIES: PEP-CTERM sorting domain-containing protein [Bradyrhizobium]KIU49588.1 hypothetical protein QU41_11685 [Bradyrhizobium elkanii]OCX31836.1 hypothetical protein QU42_06195 [Bradyrhizobium sp. UASWS1016]